MRRDAASCLRRLSWAGCPRISSGSRATCAGPVPARWTTPGGAVGQQAIARALLAHVEGRWSVRAQRLRLMLSDDPPPLLPGWAADPSRRPSTEPWGHLRGFIESLGRAVGG